MTNKTKAPNSILGTTENKATAEKLANLLNAALVMAGVEFADVEFVIGMGRMYEGGRSKTVWTVGPRDR